MKAYLLRFELRRKKLKGAQRLVFRECTKKRQVSECWQMEGGDRKGGAEKVFRDRVGLGFVCLLVSDRLFII
jgi:hypothetical protein